MSTVADLITALQAVPGDLPVRLDGCDCTDWWHGDIDVTGEYVILLRRDGSYLDDKNDEALAWQQMELNDGYGDH